MAKSNSEFKSIQKKLVAAVAMVLVASIMVVSSSYAWFTLSTAPEVTGIQTSVGSNGNLEMALRKEFDLTQIRTEVGKVFPEANNYWGNLVDLSDSSYHMDAIALAPARLNATLNALASTYADKEYKLYSDNASEAAYAVGQTYNGERIKTYDGGKPNPAASDEESGDAYIHTITTDGKGELVKPVYELNGGAGSPYLQTPVYGADGRVSKLDAANVINGTFDENAKGFTAKDNVFGVRAIGTSSSMTPEQLALRSAKQAVSSAISNAKTSASASLRDDSVKLASIIIDYKLDDKTTYDKDDVANIRVAVNSLNTIAAELENALYQAIIAVGVSQGLDIKTTDITIGANTITATDTVKAQSINWDNQKDMQAVICAANDTLTSLEKDLGEATTALDSDKLKADSGIEFDDISVPLTKLIKTSDIRIVDSATGTPYTVDGFMEVFKNNPLTAGKILMTTPTISLVEGIYAYIAKFAGNFSATTSMVVSGEYGSLKLDNETVSVIMATSVTEPKATYTIPNDETEDQNDTKTVDVNGYYLSVLLNQLSAVKPSGNQSQSATVITDVYGYAVDMAFRTNAKGSSLLLQTAPANRVSDQSGDITQGGGSYMQFTAGNAEFELYQVVNLMKTIRVVFMNDAGNIFGVATLDVGTTNLTQTVEEDGKQVVKNVKFKAGTEGHDLADANGDALTLSAGELVVIDGKQYIRAYLQMTGFTVSADGIMSIGQKLDSPVITALQQNVPTAVTTLVYMDGDQVQNGDVAISGKSMVGTMNLQFASDAELNPMDYTYNNAQVETPTAPSINDSGIMTITNSATADVAATGYEVYYNGKLIGSVKASAEATTTLNLKSYLDRLPAATYEFELVGTRDGLRDSVAVPFSYTKTAATPAPGEGN